MKARKPVVFLGDTLRAIREFPDDAGEARAISSAASNRDAILTIGSRFRPSLPMCARSGFENVPARSV